MKKLVLGSLNIDCTYQVEDFVRPKETISALHFERFCGGKGFNQAVALARAGSETWFAGVLGADGDRFSQRTKLVGVVSHVKPSCAPSNAAVLFTTV